MSRRRRTVMAVPVPADVDDLAAVLEHVSDRYEGGRVDLVDGQLAVTVSRPRPIEVDSIFRPPSPRLVNESGDTVAWDASAGPVRSIPETPQA